MTAASDAKLATDIGAALKKLDAIDASRKAQAIAAGKLLAEAQKRHPTDKAFEEFLATVPGGVQIRRARDLIAIAAGRKDFEKHQADHAAAQQRCRNKLKALPRAASRDAVTDEPKSNGQGRRNFGDPNYLDLFKMYCRDFLPLFTEADLKKARAYVMSDEWRHDA